MRNIRRLSATIGLMMAAQLALACEQPREVTIPDGLTASEQEMTEGSEALKHYMLGMKDYQACIEAKTERRRMTDGKLNATAMRRRENAASQKHNAASDAMAQTSARFRKASSDYQSRQ